MLLISIDPSIQSTAVSIYDTETKKTMVAIYTKKLPAKKKTGVIIRTDDIDVFFVPHDKGVEYRNNLERYDDVCSHIYSIVEQLIEGRFEVPCEMSLMMEGASFGSKGKLYDIGRFCGILESKFLAGMSIVAIDVPPSEWKKAMGLGGNAKKEVIYKSQVNGDLASILAELVAKGMGWKKGSPVEDLCDAYLIGKHHLNVISA